MKTYQLYPNVSFLMFLSKLVCSPRIYNDLKKNIFFCDFFPKTLFFTTLFFVKTLFFFHFLFFKKLYTKSWQVVIKYSSKNLFLILTIFGYKLRGKTQIVFFIFFTCTFGRKTNWPKFWVDQISKYVRVFPKQFLGMCLNYLR